MPLKEILYFSILSVVFLASIPLSDLINNQIFSIWLFLFNLAVLVVLLSFSYETLNRKNIFLILKDIFSAKVEGFYGFLGIIFMLTLISWFADYFREGKPIFALSTFLDLFIIGILFIKFYPLHHKTIENRKRTLIMALSDFRGNKKDFEKEILNNEIGKKKLSSNWELPLRQIKKYENSLEKIYLITSKESYKQVEDFKKFLNLLSPLITQKLVFKGNIDFNDFKQIKSILEEILDDIYKNGFSDNDIVVNISGGTSAMTLGLTLFALEKGRLITYFEQGGNPSELYEFNVNKEDAIAFLKSLTLE